MSPPCIALIDDDPWVHRTLHLLLAKRGYVVVGHARATGALPFVRQHQPALVLMELHLEYLDAAFDVMRALRDDPVTAAIPILILSTDVDVEFRVASLARPQVYGISKRIDVALLLAGIDKLVARGGTPG
jgi:CheY-like chemotaxis protein